MKQPIVVGLTVILVSLGGGSLVANAREMSGPLAREKKICQRLLPTGSIMPKTVCRTKAEWAAQASSNQGETEHMRDNTTNRTMGQLGR